MSALNKVMDLCAVEKTRIYVEDPQAVEKLGRDLLNRMARCITVADPVKVLLCIGTDRSTGDCLGPLVGTKVMSCDNNFYKVYGTLDHPVHAGNLKEKLEEIRCKHANPFIIAVDACLGQLENVGFVSLGDGSLQPGAGVNKNLPPVGQIHITGIVNVGGFMEFLVLQNTRLNLVMRLADTIANGLVLAIGKTEVRGWR